MTGERKQARITLALDAIDCSNRCRHCEVTMGPHRRHLSRDEIRAWAERVQQEMARLSIQAEVGTTNTELLDHPQWRGICDDLGHTSFRPGFATNGRRIAREPAIIQELKERGVKGIQLTLGGASAARHDAFTRRRGSFDDVLRAAEVVLSAGIPLAWTYIAYRPLAEVARMSELARAISGEDESVFLVKPQRAGARMEHLRPSRADLEDLPEHLRGRFPTWFSVGCETESELVAAICRGERRVGCLERGDSLLDTCVVIYRNGDAYPLCHERNSAFRLGNLNSDGLETVVERLRSQDAVPALAVRRRGLAELAAQYGDRASELLHSGCSLCRTLVRRALTHEGFAR